MNKLKCRKQKMNGSFECKKTSKIINIKECSNCKYKEYKSIESDQFKKTKKSSKLAKLERNRKSVFTDNLDFCIIYGNKKDNLHEIFF